MNCDSDKDFFVHALKQACLAACFLLIYNYAVAQSSFRFQQLGNDNSLQLTDVQSIAQDALGYLWFGALNGLYRYDGYDFKLYAHDEKDAYSISDNHINIIYFDKEGMMWVGTRNGLNCYYANSGKFQHFLTDKPGAKVSGHDISDIKQDRFGNYWVGTTEAGLYALSNKKIIGHDSLFFKINQYASDVANPFSLCNNDVQCIYIDEKENEWVATEGGLSRFKVAANFPAKISFENFRHSESDTSSLYNNDVWKIYEDHKQRLWFVELRGSIDLLSENNKISFHHFFPLQTVTKDNSTKMLFDIFIDKKSRAWIASKQYGLLMFDIKEKNSIVTLDNIHRFARNKFDPASLTDDFVWKVFQDNNGLLWFGTSQGIARYNPFTEQFRVIKTDNVNSNFNIDTIGVNCIYRDKYKNTWLAGTYGSFWLLKNGKLLEIKFKIPGLSESENKKSYAIAICKSKNGNLYIGTDKNILIYPSKEVKKIISGKTKGLHTICPEGMQRNTILSLNEFNDSIYVCTARGLYEIDDANFKIKHLIDTSRLATDNKIMRSACRDFNDRIWIGTDGGLLCYHAADSSIDIYKHIIGDTSSLSNLEVQYVFTDKNNTVWAGTAFGLNKFIPATKSFKCYHVSNGLVNEQVIGIAQDKNSNLWISTLKGLSEFNAATEVFKNYSMADGLNLDRLNISAIFYSDDKLILLGSDRGLNSFYPDSLHTNTKPPNIELTDFSIFTTSIFTKGYEKLQQAFTAKKEMVLNYQQNFFNISFVALNFLNTEKNQYAYILKGVNHDWVYCGNSRNANYTNVAPGHYTFKVKAANNDGVWNEQGISIPVTILPPWWQTWWFRSLAILNVIGLIFFSLRYYLRQKLRAQQQQLEKLKAIESVRSKISMDIHDEIGSQLTKISLLSQRIKIGFEKKKEIDAGLIDKITESSKEVVGNLGEIIWTVNPKYDNLQSLLAYLRNYISNFFEHTAVNCTINFPDEIPAITISPDLKHNLFLAIKESLNNIIKHAEATKVEISFQFTNQTFYFKIIDDGKGMADIKGREFGNGLLNMRNRMEAVNCKFEIESEKDKGTKITLCGEL